MSIYRLLLVGISLILIYNGFSHFLKFKKARFFILFVISIGMLLFSLVPQLAQKLSAELGIGSNLNTLIFTGFVVMFIFIVKLNKSVEQLRQDITLLVSKNAIDHSERSEGNVHH